MIVDYDVLVEKNYSFIGDVSPREALAIKFGSQPRKYKETIVYITVDGSRLAIDLDDKGEVLGIEVV